MLRTVSLAAIAGLAAYYMAWAFAAEKHARDAVDKATIIALVFGALAIVLQVIPFLSRRAALTPDKLKTAADALAQRIIAEEGKALKSLLGAESSRINVGFSRVTPETREAQGARQDGWLTNVIDYYRDLSTRRLVITGEAGSGKTALALELLVQILREREEGKYAWPVPVRVAAPRRGGEHGSLEDWITYELDVRYGISPTDGLGMLNMGLLLPVLDGLDEMDPDDRLPLRAGALIRELNMWERASDPVPLVLTCRTEQYEKLQVHPELPSGRRGTRLLDAATVEIGALSSDQIIEYLKHRVVDRAAWDPVIRRLSTEEDYALSKALSTPWRLTLAATVYDFLTESTYGTARPRSPEELLRHTHDMDEHLLRDYVRAAAETHPAPRHRFSGEDAERWLTQLAVYLNHNQHFTREIGSEKNKKRLSGTDIILHELWPFAGVRRVRAVDTTLAAVMSIPGFIWFAAFCFSRSWPWSVLFVIFLAGYAIALRRITQAYWVDPCPLDLKQLVSLRGAAQIIIAAGFGTIAALIFTPLAGAAMGIGVWIGGGISITPTQGLVTRVLPISSPRNPLRTDMRLSIASGLSGTFALGLAFSQYLGPAAGWPCAVVYAALVGLTVASAPWRRYLSLLICTRGRLPWRLGEFLDWADGAAILRTSGIAYQFRHQELQQWLATHTTSGTP